MPENKILLYTVHRRSCISFAKQPSIDRNPVNKHRWPNAEYVSKRLALADLHWAMRRTNRPTLTLALNTGTRPSQPASAGH